MSQAEGVAPQASQCGCPTLVASCWLGEALSVWPAMVGVVAPCLSPCRLSCLTSPSLVGTTVSQTQTLQRLQPLRLPQRRDEVCHGSCCHETPVLSPPSLCLVGDWLWLATCDYCASTSDPQEDRSHPLAPLPSKDDGGVPTPGSLPTSDDDPVAPTRDSQTQRRVLVSAVVQRCAVDAGVAPISDANPSSVSLSPLPFQMVGRYTPPSLGGFSHVVVVSPILVASAAPVRLSLRREPWLHRRKLSHLLHGFSEYAGGRYTPPPCLAAVDTPPPPAAPHTSTYIGAGGRRGLWSHSAPTDSYLFSPTLRRWRV
mmetsp:Transcript_27512/g.59713  ORF Transcript_27512/g.59713 Transcript_27512/m.59713 type:complete len:313 (+) Transcript_27512:324-1262(+)